MAMGVSTVQTNMIDATTSQEGIAVALHIVLGFNNVKGGKNSSLKVVTASNCKPTAKCFQARLRTPLVKKYIQHVPGLSS